MTRYGITKRRLAIAVLPAAAVLAGGAGVAAAATGGSGHGDGNDLPAYHSSVTTGAHDDNGNDAAQDRALTKLAKVTLPQAAQSASQAVRGGTVTGVELGNEAGNVVYTVSVVTAHGESEVIIDAGNGHVLAKQVEQENEQGDQGDHAGGTTPTTGGTAPTTGGATSHTPAGGSTPGHR